MTGCGIMSSVLEDVQLFAYMQISDARSFNGGLPLVTAGHFPIIV